MRSAIKNFYRKITGIELLQHQSNLIQDQLSSLHKKTDELTWAQVFNNAIANSGWFNNTALNPGRWAAGYPMLYLLYRIYNQVKPTNILEFGLGESTKLLYQYNMAFPESRFLIVEQNAEWLDFFSDQFFNVRKHTVLSGIEKKIIEGNPVNQYKNLLENIGKEKYDMIVVDGPWGSPQYSRYQVVEMAEQDLIAGNFIIVMDDYNRPGEKQTIEKLKAAFQGKEIEYVEGIYSGIKDTYIICCKKYGFLTSL